MYVVSGAPELRDPVGERPLAPGELVAFPSGPLGAHTVHGPGRVVMFSAGASGWGEAFVTVYPDSDKIAAAPGVMFRRADAVESWTRRPRAIGRSSGAQHRSASGGTRQAINVLTLEVSPSLEGPPRSRSGFHLDLDLGARTWQSTLYELAPDESTTAYHYEWCREEWALALDGLVTLRQPDGETDLRPGDIVCFPQGPGGARELRNDTDASSRLLLFSTPTDRPMSAFFPDEATVEIRISNDEGFKFLLDDQIGDYWDGEPGAGTHT